MPLRTGLHNESVALRAPDALEGLRASGFELEVVKRSSGAQAMSSAATAAKATAAVAPWMSKAVARDPPLRRTITASPQGWKTITIVH